MSKVYLSVFILLCISYILYSFSIYSIEDKSHTSVSAAAFAKGKIVWQKYNCQSCHQIYGLGGYLGPDLTNTFSRYSSDTAVLEGVIRSGNRWMPSYNLSKEEMHWLLEFFRASNASGEADPRRFKTHSNGMISHE